MAAVLAQEEPRQTGPDFGKASPLGFIIVILLLIGVFVLVWSMNRHLQRVPKSFDEPAEGADPAGEHPADGAGGAAPERGTDDPADGTKREPG
nr:hypothetical protein [Mycolicibacterium vanbaalenii]